MINKRQFVVSRHRPWRRLAIVFALVVTVVASGYGLYDFGRYRGGYDQLAANRNIGELMLEIERLSERNASLIDQNAMLNRYSRIDRDAHEEVKVALNVALQKSIELREELAFYRSLVSPSEMEPGLHIQRFSVEADTEPSSFNYKLVLTQVRKNNRAAMGVVLLRFSGLLGDDTVIYSLSDIAKVNTEDLNFNFKYFQSFEGNLRFSRRFMPKSVSITVKPEGKRLKSVKKTLKWVTALNGSE